MSSSYSSHQSSRYRHGSSYEQQQQLQQQQQQPQKTMRYGDSIPRKRSRGEVSEASSHQQDSSFSTMENENNNNNNNNKSSSSSSSSSVYQTKHAIFVSNLKGRWSATDIVEFIEQFMKRNGLIDERRYDQQIVTRCQVLENQNDAYVQLGSTKEAQSILHAFTDDDHHFRQRRGRRSSNLSNICEWIVQPWDKPSSSSPNKKSKPSKEDSSHPSSERSATTATAATTTTYSSSSSSSYADLDTKNMVYLSRAPPGWDGRKMKEFFLNCFRTEGLLWNKNEQQQQQQQQHGMIIKDPILSLNPIGKKGCWCFLMANEKMAESLIYFNGMGNPNNKHQFRFRRHINYANRPQKYKNYSEFMQAKKKKEEEQKQQRERQRQERQRQELEEQQQAKARIMEEQRQQKQLAAAAANVQFPSRKLSKNATSNVETVVHRDSLNEESSAPKTSFARKVSEQVVSDKASEPVQRLRTSSKQTISKPVVGSIPKKSSTPRRVSEHIHSETAAIANVDQQSQKPQPLKEQSLVQEKSGKNKKRVVESSNTNVSNDTSNGGELEASKAENERLRQEIAHLTKQLSSVQENYNEISDKYAELKATSDMEMGFSESIGTEFQPIELDKEDTTTKTTTTATSSTTNKNKNKTRPKSEPEEKQQTQQVAVKQDENKDAQMSTKLEEELLNLKALWVKDRATIAQQKEQLEKVKREHADTEKRFREVTHSLAMQAAELVSASKSKRDLEELLCKERKAHRDTKKALKQTKAVKIES